MYLCPASQAVKELDISPEIISSDRPVISSSDRRAMVAAEAAQASKRLVNAKPAQSFTALHMPGLSHGKVTDVYRNMKVRKPGVRPQNHENNRANRLWFDGGFQLLPGRR